MSSAAERRQFVDALLRQANPWDVCKKALFTFSGGMKQRFGIAQALLGNPRLLIVDEPTAGLDPAARNRFLNLLSSLSSDRTVILSTHIVDDVRQLCPRMAIIAAGELLLEGSPNDTLAALNGKIWSKVVAGDDELRSLETQLPVISTHLVGGHEIRVYADTSRATVSAPSIPGWRSSISSIFQGRPRANFRTNASKLEDPTWHCFGSSSRSSLSSVSRASRRTSTSLSGSRLLFSTSRRRASVYRQQQRQDPPQWTLRQYLQRRRHRAVRHHHHCGHLRHVYPARFPTRHLSDPFYPAHLQSRLPRRAVGWVLRHNRLRFLRRAIRDLPRYFRTLG